MKQKTFNKKLVINKFTIANLTDKEKAVIRGGGTVQGRTCDGTVYGRTCDQGAEVAVEGTVQGQICDGTVHGRTCDELP
ncbi:MAG: hypothetical protein GTO45_20125 [Candidatus Aminicenantes bacterium]|nr:hypothetical protein [Candidatus Aminicenantes bacterium]NIM81104.1 hypothetical protein [Candidatus Aminicenantes bacterium]NIN20478.1 hypothetical protein [Candidatus Aminicenantes bacterium]NIN44251.1 hypothetical protein [Candidatus Aminicenantes bacterium]NIN87070.1 hypothetical protein [Candidatus Aminicenantes bacterium]